MVDPPWQACLMERARRAEVAEIAKEITGIVRSGQVLPGSIGERRTRCGRNNCACHGDPPKLHGPYWHWTRKVAAKTVGRYLSPEQVRDYGPWIENDRRLRELVARLEAIGIESLENDGRTSRRT